MYHQTGLLLNGHKLHLIKFEKSEQRHVSKPQQWDLSNLLPPAQQCLERKPDSFPASRHHRQDAVSSPRVLISRAPAATKVMGSCTAHQPMALRCFQSQRAASITNGGTGAAERFELPPLRNGPKLPVPKGCGLRPRGRALRGSKHGSSRA